MGKECDSLEFYRAKAEDIEVLTKTRVEVLRVANKLPADADLLLVEETSREYFLEGFQNDSFVAYLVRDRGKVIGTGGVSFYKVMPTFHNPSGKKAYIMNMYTHPDYRRCGIGSRTLDILVKEARARGIDFITLEATKMGRPLYEKYGFTQMEDEMELLVL